jgi:GPH family glycoside/pentoside/hexuronide:cation symporter
MSATSVPAAVSLPLRKQFAYALPAPALALIGTAFFVFIPKFYADVIGVNLGALSVIVLLTRIWDAVIDPLVGHLSDRTQTRFGRRRPWMLIASVPLAISFLCITAPPEMGATGAWLWFAIWTFLLFLFATAVVVPYEALGPELTFDYNVRNRLFGWREGGLLLGTVLAAVLPVLLKAGVGSDAGSERMRFILLGIIGSVLLLPAVGVCVRFLPERMLRPSQRPKQISFSILRDVIRLRPFRVLLIAYTIGSLGSQLPATLILFYVEYVLGSSRGGLFLVLYLATGFAFIPLWVRVGKFFEKKSVWIAAITVNTVGFAGVAFLGHGDVVLYALFIMLSAVGLGGTVVLPASMEADVIDLDEAEHGVRREGVFSGLWSISRKLSAALGAGVGLAVLHAAGYEPNAAQPESALIALRVLYAVVPCVCNLVAIGVAVRYSITRHVHAELRRMLNTREA